MRHLAQVPLNHPRSILWLSLLLTVFLSLFLPRLHVSTDRNLLAGKDNPAFQRRDEVNRLFGTSMVSVAVVKGESQHQANSAVAQLAERLKKNTTLVRDVYYRADTTFFEQNALLFAPTERLEKLVAALNSSTLDLSLLESTTSISELLVEGAQFLQNQPADVDVASKDFADGVNAVEALLSATEKWFLDSQTEALAPVTQWQHQLSQSLALPHMTDGDGYFTASDSKAPYLAIAFIQPVSNSQSMEAVAPLTDFVRYEAQRVDSDVGVNTVVTGMPSLATDELRLVSRDCVVAGFIAGLGVLLVFLLTFRSFRISLFLVLPLGAGLVWAAGFTALVYAHLTMITSYFAAVLFGLGVAFTIHIVARFHEALWAGEAKEAALVSALTGAGPGVIAGGMTTAIAFLAIVFSEFQGFAEMGVISGVGIVMILIANLTLLPAALLLWHPGKAGVRQSTFYWDANTIIRRHPVVLLLGLALFGVGIAVAPRVRFNYAVESMLPSSSDAVRGIRLLNQRTAFSSTFSITTVGSLEEAAILSNKLRQLPTVSRVEAVSMFIPLSQQEKISLLSQVSPEVKRTIRRIAARWRAASPAAVDHSIEKLADAFEELHLTLTDLSFDASRAGRSEARLIKRLAMDTSRVEKAIRRSSTKRVEAFETYLQGLVRRAIGIMETGLQSEGIAVENLPDTIRGRFVSPDEKQYAVLAYPNGDIGNKSFFFKHVDELLGVDPSMTGHAVTHRAFTEMIQKGFVQAVILSAIAVFLLVLLDLRGTKSLIIALGPLILSAGWTALLMFSIDLQFNYANLMGLPILIGTGVDYGVHLAHRAKQGGSILLAIQTTGKAIVISGVTTLIGFGSLLAGNHWGVKSLGILLVSGIFFALVAAMTVVPMLLVFKQQEEE